MFLIITRIGVALLLLIPSSSFIVVNPSRYYHYHPNAQPSPITTLFSELASLRVSEIKTELNDRGVDFSDCFDKESLLVKLKSARESENSSSSSSSNDAQDVASRATTTCAPATAAESKSNDDSTPSSSASSSASSAPQPPAASSSPRTSAPPSQPQSDAELLKDLSQMSVKDLRQELASRNLRWAGLLEKQDLVKAVFDAYKVDAAFSATGLLTPGFVCDVSQEELRQEMQASDKITTPLLVDVYATWCGPCQLMATQLQGAAKELGSAVRVVKLDSDKNEQLASELRVQGLPTLILFENGKEVKRMEGAMMKDQLVEWVVEE